MLNETQKLRTRKFFVQKKKDVFLLWNFSADYVALCEQKADAAASILMDLGMKGMNVAELIMHLEKLKWEQELRLLKPSGKCVKYLLR